MDYFKSIFPGLVATILAMFLAVDAMAAWLAFISTPNSAEFVFVGWDPMSVARRPTVWLLLLGAFMIGFWWQRRRLTSS